MTENFLGFDLKWDESSREGWCIAEVNISGWCPVDSRRWPQREFAEASAALEAFRAGRRA